jgi:hypothetical protein
MSDEIKLLQEEIEILEKALVIIKRFTKKESPESSPKNPQGTSFKLITLDQKDFDVQDVIITKLFDIKEGTSPKGVQWIKRSMVIRDQYEQEREVIAWGDMVDKMKRLAEGDRLDVYGFKEVSQYTKRDNSVITQFVVGSGTDIRLVEGHEL